MSYSSCSSIKKNRLQQIYNKYNKTYTIFWFLIYLCKLNFRNFYNIFMYKETQGIRHLISLYPEKK